MMTAALALPTNDRDWMHPSRSASSSSVQFLQCVIRHESIMAGGPNAENSSSSASGLFQFLDGTWRHYATHVPSARKYGHASQAPAAVQWEVGLLAFKWNGQGNWNGTHCGYGT
jgi:hypothetical protein